MQPEVIEACPTFPLIILRLCSTVCMDTVSSYKGAGRCFFMLFYFFIFFIFCCLQSIDFTLCSFFPLLV